MEYNKKLKIIRESCKLSTYDVAEITNISQSVVNKLETGNRRIDLEILEKLLPAYNMTLSDFVDKDNEVDNSINSIWDELLNHKDLQRECDYNYCILSDEEKEKLKNNLVFALKISLNLIKNKD